MILSVSGVGKAFGEDVVLSDITFHINEHEKAALIGRNGTGKTTLFKIITGEMTADSGTVALSHYTKIGYLAQHQDMNSERTVYDEILDMKADVFAMEERMRELENAMKTVDGDALDRMYREYNTLSHNFELQNGYAARSEAVGVLKGLGFDEETWQKPVNVLSGGQKTRVALAKLLVSSPDIILLDEPTNHLDIASISWLEGFLSNYRGAVLVVSHDRYFLNKIVSKVIEIEDGKSLMYLGDYDAFAQKKAMLRDAQRKAYENQQAYIQHQEAVIEKLQSFNREKSIKRAESRIKALDKIERLDKPHEDERPMTLKLTPCVESGKDVLTLTGLSKAFPGQDLFHDIGFLIKKGEKVALLGDNGTGKTTMLKIIQGLLPADSGEIRYGAQVFVGYYDQEQQNFNEANTVFGEISDAHPNMDNTQIRNTLAAFLFTGDDVFKPISSLSGGERGRLSLAKLMLSDANFLLLDEPTNHLDIASKEILEEAINAYTGTVLYVSHDRYFVNKTATRVLELTHNTVLSYEGDYDNYLVMKERKETVAFGTPSSSSGSSASTAPVENETKLDWMEQKEREAKKRKLANRIAALEKTIEDCEAAIAKLDKELENPDICTNSYELNRIGTEKEALEERLFDAMTEWDELSNSQ